MKKRTDIKPSDRVRVIKVHSLCQGRNQTVPWITLSGLWIKDCGFESGDTLLITVDTDKITIQPINHFANHDH